MKGFLRVTALPEKHLGTPLALSRQIRGRWKMCHPKAFEAPLVQLPARPASQ